MNQLADYVAVECEVCEHETVEVWGEGATVDEMHANARQTVADAGYDWEETDGGKLAGPECA